MFDEANGARRLRVFLRAPALAIVACVIAIALGEALAQGGERSGKAVVEAKCAVCHGTGANGAPKIGDRKAWAKRASQGLSSLTEHALKGIRQMPSHGGSPDLTDLEIGRAVTFMVNRSGGKWVEPRNKSKPQAERGGEQVVNAQCVKCHQKGLNGAPRIGDREAWTPRFSRGIDALVASAVGGHGGMPARGGRADLTDAELKGAILYMFNNGAPPVK